VIGPDGHQLGVLSLGEAINLARAQSVDLVEIAPNATPPVCRLVDYGKYRYEQSKKDKESRKHQHANKVKEVQLTASIDPHDFAVKIGHATDFLCEEMKVKASLRFRGREMAHQEFGFQVVEKFLKELAPYGHPDAPPKLAGRSINVMLSPLPRNKRAKNPNGSEGGPARPTPIDPRADGPPSPRLMPSPAAPPTPLADPAPGRSGPGFNNNPFADLDAKLSNG
jgi:translation initiation factor IF-3